MRKKIFRKSRNNGRSNGRGIGSSREKIWKMYFRKVKKRCWVCLNNLINRRKREMNRK